MSGAAGQRVDRWLWHARLVRQRSAAAGLIARSHLRLNERPITKSHQLVHPGDVLTVVGARGVVVLRIVGLAGRRGPADEARRLYETMVDDRPAMATSPSPA